MGSAKKKVSTPSLSTIVDMVENLAGEIKKNTEITEDIKKRLFVDNGNPSIQTRLERLNLIQKITVGALTFVATTLVSFISAVLLKFIF